MRNSASVRIVVCIVAATLVIGCQKKQAQEGPERVSLTETKKIAEEGYIYGLPLVMNYAIMNAYAIDRSSGQFKGPINQISNEANVYTDKDVLIPLPNSDTPYSVSFMDLRTEPLVLSVPAVKQKRYYSVMLLRWQHLQLRLHWDPYHRKRCGGFHGCWS